MADQIASAVIAVDSTSAKAAAADLDKLAGSGGRAQKSADDLARASDRAARSHYQVAKAAQGYTKSAKELAFATRNLPAQFTDIAVSLQAGQNPLTVLLQQGGQLKDMFGSVGGAARAMGNYVKGMINVWSVGAGVFAGVIALMAAAENRTSSLNESIILTGRYSAESAAELMEMAESLDSIEGATKGSAIKALTELAATGRFTEEQLRLASDSAVRMAAVTGAAIEDTAAKYELLTKDPVEGLLKLNETEHFLTEAQLARVQALVDEGRQQEAVTLAMEIHNRVVQDTTAEIRESLGGISGLWMDIKEGTRSAASAFVDWAQAADQGLKDTMDTMARFQTQQSGLAKGLLDNLAGVSRFLGMGSMAKLMLEGGDAFSGVSAETDTTAKVSPKVDSKEYEKARKAAEKLAQETEQWHSRDKMFLTDKARLETDILEMKADALELGISETAIRAREASMRERHAEKMAKREKKSGKTEEEKQAEAYARLSEATSERINLMNLELQGEDKLSGNRKAAEKLLHDLEQGYVNVNDAQAAKLRQDAEEIIRLDNLMIAQKSRNEMLQETARIQERIAHESASRAASADMELAALEHSGSVLELIQAQKDVAFRADQDRYELRQRAAELDMLHSEEYLNALEMINAAEERALQAEVSRMERKAAAQLDWRNGAQRAMEEIQDTINDVAGQTRDGFVSAFNAMNQAVDEFARTGEVNIKRFATTVLAELAKIALRIMVSNALTSIFGGAASGAGAGAGGTSPNGFGTGPAMQGAAIQGGQRLHMMSGGIVDSPTLFPMANGGSILAGEHDAEGILPLKRMSGGKLGVQASGGGGGGMTIVTNVTINNGEATSETSSSTQDEDGRRMAKMLEKRVVEIMIEQRRQGGVLWSMQNGR